MIPYFGNHSSKQYIHGKPIRYGFKVKKTSLSNLIINFFYKMLIKSVNKMLFNKFVCSCGLSAHPRGLGFTLSPTVAATLRSMMLAWARGPTLSWTYWERQIWPRAARCSSTTSLLLFPSWRNCQVCTVHYWYHIEAEKD